MFCMFKCVKCGYIPSNRGGGSQYYCKKHNEDQSMKVTFMSSMKKKLLLWKTYESLYKLLLYS